MFGRTRARMPEVSVPAGRLPHVKVPSVKLPELRLPEVSLPQVQIPSRVDIPSLHVAGLRTPDLEILARNGLRIRRRRANPLWLGLKFLVGALLGVAVGCVVAALLAPAAGEDTRNRLTGMLPKPGETEPETRETRVLPALGANGNPKGRLRLAVDAFKRQRELKERELMAEFERAKRTGEAP